MATIDPLPPSERPQSPERTQVKQSKASGQISSKGISSDRLEISNEAQQGQLSQKVKNLPDIREDRVEKVRALLKNGNYDNEEVRRIIADRLLKQLGL